jgi:hypothetical protein
MKQPRLWTDHAYMNFEDVDDIDLTNMARVSLPGWSDDRPDTAMVHFGTEGCGVSLSGTVPQLRRLLEQALTQLNSVTDRSQAG